MIFKKKSLNKPLEEDPNLQNFLKKNFNNNLRLNSMYTPVILMVMNT
jgi:hypothetical protein